NCEQVCFDVRLLVLPGLAAIVGAQDDSLFADDVSARSIRESDRVQPLFQIRRNVGPRFATVFSPQDRPACADCQPPLRIKKLNVFEPRARSRPLHNPTDAAIFGLQHVAPRTNSTTDLLLDEANAEQL